jgi:multicomponent Na+:H+ antiporter subunit F
MTQLYLTVTAVAILIVMALALTRAILGPSVYDRALAVNMFGTKTVLLISVVDFLGGRQEFLDISLAYALISFISVIAMLKFYRYADVYRPEETSFADEEAMPP